jgi:ADP-ribose pyrophosphatase
MEITVTASDLVYQGRLSRVRVDRLRFPDGSESAREVVEHLDAVAVVPLHDDGTVTLLRQYRHPLRAQVLEIPAGVCDVDGEPVEQTAARELAEEVGLCAEVLTPLATMANSAGWTDERTTIFLATGLHAADAPDGFTAEAEEAGMAVVRPELGGAIAEVAGDAHADAKTLAGLLLAERAGPAGAGPAGERAGAGPAGERAGAGPAGERAAPHNR